MRHARYWCVRLGVPCCGVTTGGSDCMRVAMQRCDGGGDRRVWAHRAALPAVQHYQTAVQFAGYAAGEASWASPGESVLGDRQPSHQPYV